MMNTGLTFGSEGPMMEGTWYNTRTGDSFTVRDSFFEDNQFVITTTDGRYLKYEQIQDYIKSDKPIEIPKKQTKSDSILLPPEVAGLLEEENYNDMIMADDLAMIQGQGQVPVSLGNLKDSMTTNPYPYNPNPTMRVAQSTPVQVNTNYDIISKALSKRTLPDFQVGIEWLACPVKEMNMLIDLMDVQEQEIVDWYLSQVDIQTTTLMIKEVIKDYLMKQLHPEVTEDTKLAEMIPQPQDMDTVTTIEKPTKKTTKKTKK